MKIKGLENKIFRLNPNSINFSILSVVTITSELFVILYNLFILYMNIKIIQNTTLLFQNLKVHLSLQ